ncbi:MAG TPA: hypothetical protein VES73_14300 [Lamprocystis sp. (in: g-proteobacteria)]|nr:hypothetical protein [Lamprocystis sp. (in: g-proteobacteria)]
MITTTEPLPARGAVTRNLIGRQVAGVDGIEIKVTIPDAQIDEALGRYTLTVDNDQERFIYFFDTPDLHLFKAGMIARARRTVGGEHDSTVKFRPVVPTEVPAAWRAFDSFKLETDASETGMTKSASLTMPVAKGLIKQVVAGEASIDTLFTKEQEEFLTVIGKQQIDWGALRILGPLEAHRWKFEDPACPWEITAELWKRADGARLMELSIKTPVVQAAAAIAGFLAFLAETGAERDLEQQTKTLWALDHHAAALRTQAAAGLA